MPPAARAGMSFCTIPVNGWELLVQMESPGRWLKVSMSRQSCLDGIIPVDGSEFWVTVKLPDGIIPVDGRIPVDGAEFRVTVKLS